MKLVRRSTGASRESKNYIYNDKNNNNKDRSYIIKGVKKSIFGSDIKRISENYKEIKSPFPYPRLTLMIEPESKSKPEPVPECIPLSPIIQRENNSVVNHGGQEIYHQQELNILGFERMTLEDGSEIDVAILDM